MLAEDGVRDDGDKKAGHFRGHKEGVERLTRQHAPSFDPSNLAVHALKCCIAFPKALPVVK